MRLLAQIYHLNLLIWDHCSFYFHAFVLVVLWQWKLSFVNDIGRDCKLTTVFDKILTFSLARMFDFVFSLGVKNELKTPVMGVTCPATFEEDCFDIVKNI